MPVPDPASGGNRWSVDFLFVDQDAVPTFVECKRFNDTRSRREVVGQVMEYAANGQFYWDHATLTAYAEKTASAGGESLGDALTKLQQEEQLSSDLFFQKMEENLKEGRLRIVFFMEEAPVELKSIVEFLNNQMDRTEVLIIEARQYIKDSLRLIVPSLFGYTEQARQIKQVASIRTSEERRSWDRQSALEYISGNAPKEMLAPVKALLVFVENIRFCPVAVSARSIFRASSLEGTCFAFEVSKPKDKDTCYENRRARSAETTAIGLGIYEGRRR
jgi:hypothetical protein